MKGYAITIPGKLRAFQCVARVRRAAMALLVTTSMVILGACSDGPSEPTTPVGSYLLSSVNGTNVPYTMFEDGGYSLEVASGTMEVGADDSFVIAVTTLETVDVIQSEYVDSLRGTFTRDQMGDIQFSVAGGTDTFVGSWQGRRITVLLVEESVTLSLLFQRR